MTAEPTEALKLLRQHTKLCFEFDSLQQDRSGLVDRRSDALQRHASNSDLGAIESEFVEVRRKMDECVKRIQDWSQKWNQIGGASALL